MLNTKNYLDVIEKTALTSVDLIIEYNNKILLGLRNNNPAKNYWFTPGCRTYRMETQKKALIRLAKTELNFNLNTKNCKLLGVYDHIYDNNFNNNNFGTHYVNTCYYLKINSEIFFKKDDQHENFKWFTLKELEESKDVHNLVKLFIPDYKRIKT